LPLLGLKNAVFEGRGRWEYSETPTFPSKSGMTDTEEYGEAIMSRDREGKIRNKKTQENSTSRDQI